MKREEIIHPIVTNECNDSRHRNEELLSRNSKAHTNEELLTIVTHLDTIKPIDEEVLDQYAAVRRKVMRMLGKSSNDKLDYHIFKKALEMMNVNVLESRVVSLFTAAAMDASNCLSCSDLEIAFMINDLYPANVSSNSIFEIFSSFDMDGVGELNFEQFKECINTLVFDEGNDPKDVAYLAYLFRNSAPSGRLNFKSFAQLWCRKLADVNKHIKRQREELKEKQVYMNKIRRILSSIKFHIHRKEMLRREITRPGHDIITQFRTVRKQIIDMRLTAQKTKDKQKRKTIALLKKQNRKTLVSASRRKKDMSLILRCEGEKTDAMMEGNRMAREKLLKDCENESHNIELIEQLKRQEKINRQQQEIYRTSADRMIIRDQNLGQVPISLYSDQNSQLKLADVKILDLSGNEMKQLPSSNFFFHFISLRKLCLSRNELIDLPNEISYLKKVEVFLVEENYLKSLPTSMSDLKALQVVDLSSNKLSIVQDELCSLCNLRILKLHSNELTKISDQIGNLKSLELIDISNNNLSFLPESFCFLENLVSANLSNNELLDLPSKFEFLQQLEYLDLSFNNLHVSRFF